MQVSQIQGLDSHIVIGGATPHAFGMSDSAEFFTVLSDTLYRDKLRAVVREVVCNAWDAHLISGKADVPIEITLSDTELVIKDVGPGIADDRMVPIYCIYGASTKAKDNSQTGGFGLGSKAPFAYSDHFTVTSCHDGKRTVYAISRGGVATDGKPELRAMISVPTTESGITVAIPLRDPADKVTLAAHIKAVVLQGGINAKLDGAELPRIDYSIAGKRSYLFLPASFSSLSESRVYVRYGAVLYPVSTTDAVLTDLVRQAYNLATRHIIVLLAAPGTIGVTPSREALSYSDKTTAEVSRLLRKTISALRGALPGAKNRVIQRAISRVPKEMVTSELFFHMNTEIAQIVSATIDNGRVRGATANPDAIADITVYDDFATYHSGTRTQFRWKLLATNPNFRRAARRTKVGCPVNGHAIAPHVLGPYWDLLKSTQLWKQAFVLRHTDLRPISDQVETILGVPLARLLVAPNQRQALKVLRQDDAETPKRTLVLVLNRASAKLLAEVAEQASRLKIPVQFLDFEKATKSNRPARLFRSVKNVSIKGVTAAPTLDKSDLVLRVRGRASSRWRYSGLLEACAEMYPNAAFAETITEEDRILKLGAKRVCDAVIEAMGSLATNSDLLIGYVLASISDRDYDSRCAVEPALAEPRLVSALFDIKVKSADEVKRGAQLFEIFTKLSIYLGSGSRESDDIVIVAKLDTLSKQTNRLVKDHPLATLKYGSRSAARSMLESINFSKVLKTLGSEDARFNFVRTVRRAYMKAVTNTPTPTPDQKEAA